MKQTTATSSDNCHENAGKTVAHGRCGPAGECRVVINELPSPCLAVPFLGPL